METNIKKWGNGLGGVGLLKQITLKQSLKAGSWVAVTETATGVASEVVKNKNELPQCELGGSF